MTTIDNRVVSGKSCWNPEKPGRPEKEYEF